MELSKQLLQTQTSSIRNRNKSLDDIADHFNINVYNYMADNYGLIDNASDLDKFLKEKYTDYNKHKLKKCLRLLKANELENLNEIRFVSKLIRSKIQTEQSSVTTASTNINHNEMIKLDFWKYVKRFIEKPTSNFQSNSLFRIFQKNITVNEPYKAIYYPILLEPPIYQYDITSPTYQEITKIIRRMKASGSPCRLDEISIIVFKRCPYLRSYLELVFRKISSTGQIPDPLCGKKQLRFLFTKKASKTMHKISEQLPLKLFL